jgi:hypothetical protein
MPAPIEEELYYKFFLFIAFIIVANRTQVFPVLIRCRQAVSFLVCCRHGGCGWLWLAGWQHMATGVLLLDVDHEYGRITAIIPGLSSVGPLAVAGAGQYLALP